MRGVTTVLSTTIGCASRSIRGDRDVEVVAGERGEADHPIERVTHRAAGSGRAQRFAESRRRCPQAEDLDRLPEHVEVAAVDDEVEVFAAFPGDLAGDEEVRLRRAGP